MGPSWVLGPAAEEAEMAKIRLTEKALKSLPSPVDDAQAYFWDHEVRGFGVVVGRDGSRGTGARTFIVRGRVAGSGERVKVKIGGWQEPRDDQQFWTVELARERARAVLGQLAAGTNPNAPRDEDGRPLGPTLREGVQTHLAKMKKKNQLAAVDPDVRARDEQVPRRLARPADSPS